MDLHVVFDARTEGNRHWHVMEELPISHTYASGFSFTAARRRKDGFPRERREMHLRYGVLAELIRLKPEVVISQELGFRSLVAHLYCSVRGIPLILWQEGTPHTEGWVGSVRRLVRHRLCRHATRVWGNGLQSAALVHEYAPHVPTDDGMTGVDTSWFQQSVREVLPRRPELRHTLATRDICFLFVGQLVERKGVRQMLQAIERAGASAHLFTLLLAGEGSLRGEVEAWCAAHPAYDVQVLGHLAPEQLVELYAIADVFVLPSLDDNWALATLEGAVAGLRQIFSKYNGAYVELMAQHVEGTLVDPLQIEQLQAAFQHFAVTSPSRLPDNVVDSVSHFYSPRQFALRAATSIRAALVKTE